MAMDSPKAATLLAISLALALPRAARAQGSDTAAADALFQQAKALTEAQKWAEACPKFEASYKLDKTLGTLLNLSDCEEHVGRIATAWAHFGEAVELAGKTGDKREAYASERRAKLTKRLPMVRIDATGNGKLAVYRDEVRIDPAAYGVPLPSDPGPHVITVRRGEEKLATRNVEAREGETAGVALDLAAIEKAAPPPPPPPSESVWVVPSGQRTAGFVIGGVGLVTLAGAGALGAVALANKSSANAPDACVNRACTTAGLDAIDRARTFATAEQWVGVTGILLTAVGITVVATTPRRAKTIGSIALSGWAGPGTGGAAVRGALP
jgi:hypothetical protein